MSTSAFDDSARTPLTSSGPASEPDRRSPPRREVRRDKSQEDPRPGRGRWKVPVLIVAGVLLSAVLAGINGLQLASLQRALGGLRTPEAQLWGYDTGYIELVRARMTDELLERYGASHYLWDLLFPLVFAATIILLITRICRGRKIGWFLMVPPVLFVAVDITENLTLEALVAGPSVMASAVALASTLTIMKTVLFALSIASALLALLTRPRTPADTGR